MVSELLDVLSMSSKEKDHSWCMLTLAFFEILMTGICFVCLFRSNSRELRQPILQRWERGSRGSLNHSGQQKISTKYGDHKASFVHEISYQTDEKATHIAVVY